MNALFKRRRSIALLALTVAAAVGYYAYTNRFPPAPQRILRIGFEPNPPFQIHTDRGFGGLAVEAVNEAAKRAGIHLQWVVTGTSSDEAFRRQLVDLWPLMADTPERRGRVYLSRPWIMATHILVTIAGTPPLDRNFDGKI